MTDSKRKQNLGLTLIELLLTVAIITTIGIFSAAFYSRFLLQNTLANTVDQLVGDFRKAQTYAMTGKQNSPWGVNYAANTITLYKGSSFASRQASFDETFSVNTNITISGFTDISFARATGLPSTTATINISDPGTTKIVTLNAQGVASR